MSGRDPGVTEEILDRCELRLSIEHVRGHRMAQVMTTDREAGSRGVVFHALLDPADRVFTRPSHFGESRARDCDSAIGKTIDSVPQGGTP